jgi:hypothetical protein
LHKRLRFMTDLIAPLRVPPGSEVKLSYDHDPGYTGQVARPQAAKPNSAWGADHRRDAAGSGRGECRR